MARNSDAYDRMKSKMTGKTDGFNMTNLGKKEGTYWFGAGAIASIVFGFVDGGVSVALAYGAKKLYEINNTK